MADATTGSGGEIAAPDVHAEVAVVGAGPTGLTTALALARAGIEVALVARAAPRDPRTTALLHRAIRLQQRLGAWQAAEPHAAPLRVMRLVDDTGRLPQAPEVAFEASEIGLEAFGYNIANDDLNAALDAALAGVGKVQRVDAAATAMAVSPEGVQLTTEVGGRVAAQLVVGADGASSFVREAAGIGVRRWSYEQRAFVSIFAHTAPHHDTSTEFHRASGPFTVVPLPGNRSSLVWVDRPEEIDRVMTLGDHVLAQEVATRAHHLLGDMRVAGPRGTIALEGLLAHSLVAGRVALVGESGHRFPPIGAQGLNLGIRDAETLAATLGFAHAAGVDLGSAEVLARYDRRRRIDVVTRTAGVDLLNRSLLTGFLPVSLGRSLALVAAKRIAPMRRMLMRAGVGGTPLTIGGI